jgi:hypothetical protein
MPLAQGAHLSKNVVRINRLAALFPLIQQSFEFA